MYVESTCIDEQISLKDKDVKTSGLNDLPIMVFAGRNATSFWDLNSECLRQLLERTGFRVTDMQKWGKRMLAKAEAVDDPKLQRVNIIARGTVPRG
jgi:hypothetical protein